MHKKSSLSKSVKFNFDGIELDLEFDLHENTISSEISLTSCWEPWQLKLYPVFLENGNATFVDIGANVGVNSLFAKARNPNARIISVEPDPINITLLKANIQKAQLDIEVYPFAISNRNDFITLVGDKTHAHIGSEDEVNSQRVDSLQLDKFILQASITHIQLLKIDVEGFTDLVLSSSQATLKITECAIVEFSLTDLDLRFHGDENAIRNNIEKDYHKLTSELKNVYYISRTEGLVSVGLAEFREILLVEFTVGDFLFSRMPQTAISIEIYLLRKIRILQNENHLRILENKSLNPQEICPH